MSQGDDKVLVNADVLRDRCAALFEGAGLSGAGAGQVATVLVGADLRGVTTHGVARVPLYLDRLMRGLVNPRPEIKVERRRPTSLVIDGDNGMGAVVGTRAMDEVIARAREIGIGAATVRHSNHFGAAAIYVQEAARQGCIGMAVSPASPSLAPFGAREPLFGTNPIAMAVPTRDRDPWVMDMATSVAARGAIRLAAKRGQPIPEGWALDREGRPTTDPVAAMEGLMVPFAGPKGSALAMMVEIMGGVLAGASATGEVGEMGRTMDRPQNVGHFMMAMDIDAFMDRALFDDRMEDSLRRLKALKPAAGFKEVLYPGELEARRERHYRRHGVPLSRKTAFEPLSECLKASGLHELPTLEMPDSQEARR
ncbi:Ldh family oxidoreductase [Fodinicurvata sp. EGI_FJ10296]|uniref:Ldh family oxidoreductase n=1 Tax=Fodinicurvata sp. EGI_FJ10296 TaxID=3231908 RepID=UPI003455D798